jgi:hypothetical protein
MPFPERPAAPPSARESTLAALANTLEDAEFGGGGEALEERLDEESNSDVAYYGVALLTAEELFGAEGEGGLCEPLELLSTFEEDGTEYEASYAVEPYLNYGNDPEPIWQELSEGCSAALLAQGGDIDAAEDAGDCSVYEVHQWFLDESDCRECVVAALGDFDSCVESEACPEETVAENYLELEQGTTWYDTYNATLLACAPDWSIWTTFIAQVDVEGDLPDAFDHSAYGGFCIPFWYDKIDGVGWWCTNGLNPGSQGDILGEGAFLRANYIRPVGDETTPHQDRMGYADRVELDQGRFLRWMHLSSFGGAGTFSLDSEWDDTNQSGAFDVGDYGYGYPMTGLGLHPYALRPDGTDVSVIDDTFARDWLAVDAVKTATTIDGILVTYINHNACAEDDWVGPDDDGSSWCQAPAEPTIGWLNDGENLWANDDSTDAQPYPQITLGSTGLPDPAVPGGIVLHVVGSTTLANPDWEGCAWPDAFTPDLHQIADDPSVPQGTASLTAETWRFDAHPERDFRVVLATNQLRGFCPEDPTWSD